MRRVLHIVTEKDDALSASVIAIQSEQNAGQVIIADLTVSEPDYDALLEEVFKADSITVW